MLVLSALVVGSLAPDFRYFFELAPAGHFGHSLKGVFFFCLPAGLAMLWLFHSVMKLPLISLAPYGQQQRLACLATPFRWAPFSRFLLIVCSILVGALSHLAWDAFTHERGLVVRNVPDLRSPMLEEFGSHRPLYNMLQHGSSLVGLALLGFWYWRWLKSASPEPVPSSLKLDSLTKASVTASMVLLAGGVSLTYAYSKSRELASLSIFVTTTAVAFPSLVFVEIVGFSLWWQWRRSKQLANSIAKGN